MSQLAADLASEASNLSMLEVESTDRLRKRKRQPKQKNRPTPEEDAMTAGDVTNTNYTERDNPEVQAEDNASLLAIDDPVDTSLRSKLRAKDRTIAMLQQKLAAFESADLQETVDICDGFSVSAGLVRDLKLNYKHNPGMFLRNLMEKSNMFTLEEIAESSLTGQKHSGGIQRPELNPRKFNTCKDFTIKKCKVKEDSIRMMQFKKSMVNICTDARKRIKKQNSS